MAIANGGPSINDGLPVHSSLPEDQAPDSGVPAFPARARGVQLLGQAKDSGYREPPSLVRRSDGQVLQLTPLLYLVLEAADGSTGLEDLAARVGPAFGRRVSAGNVAALIKSQLLPLGLLRLADGSEPELKRADPLLGMRLRVTVTDPDMTRRLTAPFAVLFQPVIVFAVTVAFLAACWWVLMVKGLGSATHHAFANPGLLLLVFCVTVLSAGFHEFGHAAAAARGGAVPGKMGAGLYLVWPAFFTDVTDSYRLNRSGRIRTDLGGLYFNAITAVAIMVVWLLTRDDAWLLVIATQVLQMVRQLLPLLRFDGYHILADAAGVPDLFQRIKPILLAMLPWHPTTAEAKVLKPAARALVVAWVLVTVPLLALSMALLVLALPRLLGTAMSAAGAQYASLAESASAGDVAGACARVLALLAVALPVLAIFYMLARLARQLVQGMWHKTRGKALQRGLAFTAAAAVLSVIAWAWWPTPGTYAPVQPYERGTLLDAAPALYTVAGSTGLVEGRPGQTIAVWPEGQKLPPRENPQLSLVLVPASGTTPGRGADTAAPSEGGGQAAPSWVFPFDKPPAPEADGNQALAVNTTDGSVTYDVAFALVWADGTEPVDTRNEAYAFASCDGCAAVAVGFQVVLIVGQADVVVPENLSAAANYNCTSCLTYALASQLVLTLEGPLSTDSMAKLSALWEEVAEFGRNLQNVPLSEIQARLNGYKEQIVQIIRADPAAKAGAATPKPSQNPGTAPAAPGEGPATTRPPSIAPTPTGPPPANQATSPATAPVNPATAPMNTAPAPSVTSPPSPAPAQPEATTAPTGNG